MKSPLFRLFNGKIGLYGHSRTKFVLDPKIGSGLTAKKRNVDYCVTYSTVDIY